jgi:SAM-dependent methyltransferase
MMVANQMLTSRVIRGTAYDLRAETFDYFLPDRSWEIAGWARLARRYGHRVVEWMCGTGELACGLARRGFQVIGVDLVPEMLAVAERRAAALPPQGRPLWVEDDIRDGSIPRRDNDLALIAAGAFGQMLEREDQRDALQTVRRHLRPGGALAVTLGRAREDARSEQTGLFGPQRPTPPDLALRKVVRNQYDPSTRRLAVHDHVEVKHGDSKRVFEFAFALRLFTPDEIVRLLIQAGFVSIGMFGDFDLKPWNKDSPEWIVSAERPMA